MKLWILSDLHISHRAAERGAMNLDAVPEADVCVMAGDLVEGTLRALGFLARTITLKMPVMFCLGNHEYYGEDYDEARRSARHVASTISDLHLLDDDAVTIGGVRFLGGTLWTDYALYSHGEQARVAQARVLAQRLLSDHSAIWRRTAPDAIARNWRPSDALDAHRTTLDFIDRELAIAHFGPTVVVTHHAPHPQSVARRFAGDPLTPAFVSDLSSLIDRRRPALWIHGHTHARFDYAIAHCGGGATRMICNPRGYLEENPAFDPALVVEI